MIFSGKIWARLRTRWARRSAGSHPLRSSAATGGERAPIAPDSYEFLVFLFGDLLKALPNRTGYPDSKKVISDGRVYQALLDGLAREGSLPGDEAVREHVIEIAAERGVDYRRVEAEYKEVALEHRALAELLRGLGRDWELVPTSRLPRTF
jgi:hypothetical protein